MDQIEWTDEDGVQWHKYTCEYIDGRGRRMGFDLWGTSDADAEERMTALRATAKVEGRILALVSLEGEVLTESSVPDNESGITH